MGCCSSTNGTSPQKLTSNTFSLPLDNANSAQKVQNSEQQLQHHHNISQNDLDDLDDIPISNALSRNSSILNEVMKLNQINNDDIVNDNDAINDLKTDENSEQLDEIKESVEEFATNDDDDDDDESANNDSRSINNQSPSIYNDQNDNIFHPFGMNETRKNEDERKHEEEDEEEQEENLETLYADNLKKHGFDVNKFRQENAAVMQSSQKHDITTKNDSNEDLSSFDSSKMSSSRSVHMDRSYNHGDIDGNTVNHDFIKEEEEDDDDEDDDMMLKEFSQSASTTMYNNNNGTKSYIESIQESINEAIMKNNSAHIDHIMDDEDEQLMDAIMSLDLGD